MIPLPSSPAEARPDSWRTRLPFYYGWLVVASMFVSQTMSYGVYYSFSVFFVALLEQYHWSRAAAAGVFSTQILVIGLTGVTTGALIDRFGPGRVVPAGGVLLALALLGTSQLTELWHFYLLFGVLAGLGISMCGWVPCVTVLSRWFSARRGTAIGIASAGIGLGTVLMVPLNQYLISTAGWRAAYVVLAVVSLAGIVPQAAALLVTKPEELGLKAEGAGATAGTSPDGRPRPGRRLVVVDQKWASYPWTIVSAARTSRFWLLTATISLASLTNQMMWAHQAAYLVDAGFDKMLAASMVGLAGLLSMPAKTLWGIASDRLGREPTFAMGAAAMIGAIALLIAIGSYPVVWLVLMFALFFSVGYAINAPLTPSAAGDIFGGRNFGAIYGIMSLGMGMGGAFGAWAAGYVFDTSGSYVAAFLVAGAAFIIGAAALWLAAPRKVRRIVWTD